MDAAQVQVLPQSGKKCHSDSNETLTQSWWLFGGGDYPSSFSHNRWEALSRMPLRSVLSRRIKDSRRQLRRGGNSQGFGSNLKKLPRRAGDQTRSSIAGGDAPAVISSHHRWGQDEWTQACPHLEGEMRNHKRGARPRRSRRERSGSAWPIACSRNCEDSRL
jgi:hypothetical protein